MAIAAQRFKFLNEQTNLPVKDFFNINTSDILSQAVTDISSLITNLTAMVGLGDVGGVAEILATLASDAALETRRLTRDFYSSVNDISNWTSQQIHGASARLFPNNPVLQNAFNQIGDGCKSKIIGALTNCTNKRRLSEINGLRTFTTDRSCSAESFAALINKITAGAYAVKLTDQCALMKMVAGVAMRGFEIGLPGVFSSLSGQIQDKHLLAQAGVTVINAAALDGNMNAVMDVANSSVGGMLTAIDPSIPSTILSNFTIPQEYYERDIGQFYDSFNGAMGNLDTSWNQFNLGGTMVPSLANFDANNGEMSTLLQCQNFESGVSFPQNGSVPLPSTADFLSAGMSLGSQNVSDNLSSGFRGITFSDVSDSNFSISDLW